MRKVVFATAFVGALVGCSSGAHISWSGRADIAKVSEVKPSFGPEFKVADISETAIDPKLLTGRKLPEGLTFDPANCAKAALGPDMPPDLQGNMAAVTAEGNGNRYVVIAVETSRSLPAIDPGKDCAKVAFVGPRLRGAVEAIDAPHIDGTHTSAIHRVLQAVYGAAARTGELYDYTAQFGVYQVIVIANPLVVPHQPVAKVDTRRARDLLVQAVGAVRG